MGSVPEAVTPSKVQQKYDEERSKRLRSDGLSQFIDLEASEQFKHFREDPWVDSDADPGAALTDGSHCEILILGAGYGGLLFAVRLMEAGFSKDDIRIVDSAGGFGGIWYWNRYPGLMCDVDSYIYMPLLEETGYIPKHKYAYGTELREHAENIAEKWGLKDVAMFQTTINSLEWDENEWVVKMTQKAKGRTPRDLTVRSRFVISASGIFNWPHLPKIPGLGSFQGDTFHTSRWNYASTGGSPTDTSLTKLKDKRVGILGTGATAVQAVPHLAKWSKELYIFQRTPSAVDVRNQHPTDMAWWKREIQPKRGWQRVRSENFNAFLNNAKPSPPVDMVADGWTSMPSFSAALGGATFTPDAVSEYLASLHAVDFPRQERIRRRVDEIVQNHATAEKLKPWYTGWCKRPCFHDDYLAVFNQNNVTLVDTDGRGVDEVTEQGVVVNGTEYKVDVLIFSTGFRSPNVGSPAIRAAMSIRGRDSTLDEKWNKGVSTLHGIVSRGFPNLFYPGPTQASTAANQTYLLDTMARHIAYVLSEAISRTGQTGVGPNPAGHKYNLTIEPKLPAEQEWSKKIASMAGAFAGIPGCTPGYMNKEGEAGKISSSEDQQKAAQGAIWGRGIAEYVGFIEAWREKGDLDGLEILAVA